MPFIRIRENWQLMGKIPHTVHLHVKEGFVNDTIHLYVDDMRVITATAGLSGWRGYELFEVDGRPHELRWVWSWFSGNPVSIVIMHKGRILAQYGTDRAAQDDVLEQR